MLKKSFCKLQNLLNKGNGNEEKTYGVNQERHDLAVYYKLAYGVETYNEEIEARLNQNNGLQCHEQAGYAAN